MINPSRPDAKEHLYRGYVIVISPKQIPDVRPYHGTLRCEIDPRSVPGSVDHSAAHYVEGATKDDTLKAAKRVIDGLEA